MHARRLCDDHFSLFIDVSLGAALLSQDLEGIGHDHFRLGSPLVYHRPQQNSLHHRLLIRIRWHRPHQMRSLTS
ncbi:unnamed protein product [Urochloa humidicola]